MEKMKLKNQIVLVNVAILAGFIFQHFRGLTTLAIVITGVPLLALANLIFLVRLRREKNVR
jgi:hypothetical protein